MWERMSESEGGGGSSMDFLSTHPANAKRIKVGFIPFPLLTGDYDGTCNGVADESSN